jgi:hypothetical protein
MITGKMVVDIDGKPYTLRFDWEALAEVEKNHGDQPNLFSSEVVASVAASGLKRYHPEMTAEKIRELSPPLVPFAKKVQEALQYAYFGAEGVPEPKKKPGPNTDGWWQRLKKRVGMGWTRSNSCA